jgi:hypothetical protein
MDPLITPPYSLPFTVFHLSNVVTLALLKKIIIIIIKKKKKPEFLVTSPSNKERLERI